MDVNFSEWELGHPHAQVYDNDIGPVSATASSSNLDAVSGMATTDPACMSKAADDHGGAPAMRRAVERSSLFIIVLLALVLPSNALAIDAPTGLTAKCSGSINTFSWNAVVGA